MPYDPDKYRKGYLAKPKEYVVYLILIQDRYYQVWTDLSVLLSIKKPETGSLRAFFFHYYTL